MRKALVMLILAWLLGVWAEAHAQTATITTTATFSPVTPLPTLTPVEQVPLDMSQVITTSLHLTTAQIQLWNIDSDAFGLLVGLVIFIMVWGFLGLYVGFMKPKNDD